MLVCKAEAYIFPETSTQDKGSQNFQTCFTSGHTPISDVSGT